jgi:hypothetical protein
LALPRSGWVLVDGCRATKVGREDTFPLEHIVRTYRSGDDDLVKLLLLTHPHRDHAQGIAEMLNRFDPQRVALTGSTALKRTLADEANALEAARVRQPTGQALKTGVVLRALRAMNAWAEKDGRELVAACDGVTLLNQEETSLHVRAPNEGSLREWFDAGEMAEMAAQKANWLSTVLEVTFGARISYLEETFRLRTVVV